LRRNLETREQRHQEEFKDEQADKKTDPEENLHKYHSPGLFSLDMEFFRIKRCRGERTRFAAFKCARKNGIVISGHSLLLCLSVIAIFVSASGCTPPPADDAGEMTPMTHTPPPDPTRVEYTRIYPDAQGESHFDTVVVEQSLATAAPPAPQFWVSAPGPASKYLFYSFGPGWTGDLHPAPARQFLALIRGAVEVETSDGAVMRFGPGDLILLEDTSGKGHRSRNVGDDYLTFFVVPAPAT